MGVDITLNNVGSGYSRSAINDNFEAIETAFQDALSVTDGGTMQTDIDLNGNDLLNVNNLDVETLTVDGVDYEDTLQTILTAAQLAETNAETAETNAEAAASAAATSETNAETAEVAAELAAAQAQAAAAVLVWVTPEEYGAVGDGVTDDGAAFAAAMATGLNVHIGRKTYVCGQTLTFSNTGQQVIGEAGVAIDADASKIIFTNTTGPAFSIPLRSCKLKGVFIDANTARRTGGSLTGHGVFIAGSDVAPASYPSLSRVELEDVYIVHQPADGVHAIGTIEYGRISNVTVADCMRHGFVHDGGTVSGYTNKQLPAFEVLYERCRAIECAGNGFVIRGESGNAAAGVHMVLPEALGCGWDTSIRLSAYQMMLAGASFILDQPDVEDQQYAATTTSSSGMTKTGRATPSSGIQVSGSGHQYRNPFFSSLIESMSATSTTGLEITWPRIFAGTYAIAQSIGITIASTVEGFVFRGDTADTTGATTLLRNQSVNADILIDGRTYRGLATTLFDWEIVHVSPPTFTISSGVLSFTADKFLLAGEGGAADSMATMRLASGVNGYAGLEVAMLYAGQDITFSEAGNMTFAGGGVPSLTATNPVVYGYYDGTEWFISNIRGSIGGTTGATDNRLLRSDGTGGITVQSSAITVDDTGHITAFGGNIAFPATQVASAGANVLDDYEEGTWTPGITFGGGNTGLTTSSASGTYTKIGRAVFGEFVIVLSAKGSSTGTALLTGLPITANNDTPRGSVNFGSFSSMASLTSPLIGRVVNNGTTVDLYDSGATGIAVLDDTNFTNTTAIWGTFYYEAS